MGFIYRLTSPSGKSYIGQTICPIEKRFKKHQQKSSGCVAISGAIKKYGWENFEKEWNEIPDDDLNFYEEMLIALLGTLSPDGYNLKEGGSNGKMSEESKQKNREAKLGEKNPMFGKPMSEEQKQKNREAHLGEKSYMFGKTGENSPCSKRVYQYDLDGTFIASFGSTREATRELKKEGSDIARCAQGKRKTARGFKWSYVKY
jgi:hypothetical protein